MTQKEQLGDNIYIIQPSPLSSKSNQRQAISVTPFSFKLRVPQQSLGLDP